jgi:hypothetical protein
MKKGFVGTPPLPAHQFTATDAPELHAIKALVAGKASEHQQRLFLAWFNRVSGVNENPYRPGGEDGRRETDFALGKKFVADQFYSLARTEIPTTRDGTS